MKSLKRLRNQLLVRYGNQFDTLCPNPIFILGNEKSGTTAITANVAQAAGLKVTLDIPPIWNPMHGKLHKKEVKLNDFIKDNAYYFKNQIIKEPVLSFFIPELIELYKDSKFVLIVRDPRDNIRSILNRLKIPGNLESLKEQNIDWNSSFWKSWQTVLYMDWMGINYDNYVESMALRWTVLYKSYKEHQDKVILVKYEDFMKDKGSFITQLCKDLELPVKNDFKQTLNKQFQSKGNRNTSWEEFFGVKNLERINSSCSEYFSELNYTIAQEV